MGLTNSQFVLSSADILGSIEGRESERLERYVISSESVSKIFKGLKK